MNELQIALIAFGAVLVGAVWGYNLWQEKQHRQRAEAMLPANAAGTPDVLMAGREPAPEDMPRNVQMPRNEPAFAEPTVFREPTFADPAAEAEEDQAPAAETVAQAQSAQMEHHAPLSPAIPAVPAEWADGRADCLLRIEFADPVSVAAVWAEQSGWAQRIDKPMQWLGLDAQGGRWRTLLPQDAFATAQIAAALQLADRKGAVSDKTLAAFVAGVHQLAQAYAGLVELPNQPAILQRARELDDFCAGVDLQLALYVVPRQGSLTELVGAKLKPEVEAAGLRLEGERYVAVDAAEAEVFALSFQAAAAFAPAQLETARLTALVFSLDVPRVASGAPGFERMIACARRCAEVLGGQLVDAHKKPLVEATIAAIRTRIEELQGQMAAHDIPAGGVRALRLFA